MDKLNYIKNLYIKHGVELKPFNIFGIRNKSKQLADDWNDIIGFFTNTKIQFFTGTTDPGKHYTLNPMNRKGTAHLCLGYHENIWMFGMHRGRYKAFCNTWRCNKTKVWRDIDADGEFNNNNEKKYSGHFGINLHRARSSGLAFKVGRYSAGCQVVRSPERFKMMIEEGKKSGMKKFSYFLFDYKQIDFYGDLFNDYGNM
jgi:hypothetical protein